MIYVYTVKQSPQLSLLNIHHIQLHIYFSYKENF